MISEGRPGVDEIFKLSEGHLRLEVSKPTYERLGLQGEAIPSEGRKHHKARYGNIQLPSLSTESMTNKSTAINLNLRSPNMVRGQKGFDRVLWAFDNVLTHSLAWLFCNLRGDTNGTGPIGAVQPLIRIVNPEITLLDDVTVPALPDSFAEEDQDAPAELLEWLSLVSLGSPRVLQSDGIDPYLCSYSTPAFTSGNENLSQSVQNLATLRWRGLIPSSFVTKVLLAGLKASGDEWFALTARSFEGEAFTVMKLPGEEGDSALVWEYEG